MNLEARKEIIEIISKNIPTILDLDIPADFKEWFRVQLSILQSLNIDTLGQWLASKVIEYKFKSEAELYVLLIDTVKPYLKSKEDEKYLHDIGVKIQTEINKQSKKILAN